MEIDLDSLLCIQLAKLPSCVQAFALIYGVVLPDLNTHRKVVVTPNNSYYTENSSVNTLQKIILSKISETRQKPLKLIYKS